MALSVYDHVKLLYDQGLFSNVVTLASMLLTANENNSDILSCSEKYQTLVYYGDSLAQLKEYKKAESMYRRVLQLKKSLMKSKGKAQPFPQGEVTSEVDVKYKIYLCLLNLKQYSNAIALLESISAKQKTPCVNMALAKLYHQNGMDRSAITCYKEVLKLSLWVKAHSHLHSKELTQSIACFKQLDKAHQSDSFLLKGMDVYAALLAKEKKLKELESLTQHLISVSDAIPEPWVAMAYLCYASKKWHKALNFAQKACLINPRHIEGLLLKGSVLYEWKKYQEAVGCFGDVFKVAPYRYEAHKGMVDCYLAMHRTREAIELANSACKQLGSSARALTLYASVLCNYPSSSEKAKHLLERALKQDPTYLNAVYLLANIYEQERLYEKGIELLKKQTEQQSSCRLHQMLGDFLARTNEHEKALHHFSIALNMDPTNHKAAEGSQRVETNPESSESCYEVISDSENEGDIEGSDFEGSCLV